MLSFIKEYADDMTAIGLAEYAPQENDYRDMRLTQIESDIKSGFEQLREMGETELLEELLDWTKGL